MELTVKQAELIVAKLAGSEESIINEASEVLKAAITSVQETGTECELELTIVLDEEESDENEAQSEG